MNETLKKKFSFILLELFIQVPKKIHDFIIFFTELKGVAGYVR